MHQCAGSADGKHLAVRRGATATLYSLDGGKLASCELGDAEGTLVFASGVLVDHAVRGATTIVTSRTVPRLKTLATIEIPTATRLAADNEHHLLLGTPDTAQIVSVQSSSITYAPMRVPSVVGWAVGIHEDNFLVHCTRGLEVWDTAARRPLVTSKMTLPAKPMVVGVAGQRRSLWLARAGAAELTVVRISDGKSHLVSLPAVPRRAVGHAQSSWLVVDLEGAPWAVNLVTGAGERLPGDRFDAAAILPRGAGAVVALLDGDDDPAVWEIGSPETSAPSTGAGLQLDLGAAAAPSKAPVATVSAPPRTVPRAAPVGAPSAAPGGPVTLAPDAAIRLVGGPGLDEPATVGRFVPAGVERGLATVAEKLRRAWLDLVCEDWLTETARPRADARAHLLAVAREAMGAEPGLRGAELDDRGVRLRGPLLGEDAQQPWTQLLVGRAELDLADLAAVGRALGTLDDAKLRATLDEAGALAPRGTPAFAGQLEPGTFATLGGPTVLANLGGAHVLVDPVLRGGVSADGTPLPAVGDLPPLAAILLTTDDPSGLDVPTLLALDKSVPIYAPPSSTSGRTKPLLEALGFTAVKTARSGDRIDLGGGRVIAHDPGEAAPRYRARTAYALATTQGSALLCGELALDAEHLPSLVAFATDLARTAPVSPIVLALPRRRRAPIESGWLWLLDPVDDWLRPRPPVPALDPLVAAARATAILVVGDAAVTVTGAEVRRPDPYDRYRLGASQDGWLSPR